MTPTPISFRELPRRHYYPAALFNAHFDDIVTKLGAKPRRLFLKEGRGWYRQFAVSLRTGRYATLTQWEDFPQTIEISIELVRNLFFYEDDLLEILVALDVNIKDTTRAQAHFKWKKGARHAETENVGQNK